MTRVLFFLLANILNCTLYSQSYEGAITYKITIKSKIAAVTDEQFSLMQGDVQEYLVKGGNYKSDTNGSLVQWQVYINADNKLYSKMSNSETIIWNDGAENGDEVLKAEIKKDVLAVLEYKCDELVLMCKSGVQKYYFNSSLAVDPTAYEKHKYGNWAEVVSRTKSLPLKSIIENQQFTLQSIATEVKPMQLSDDLFVLPAGVKTIKNPN